MRGVEIGLAAALPLLMAASTVRAERRLPAELQAIAERFAANRSGLLRHCRDLGALAPAAAAGAAPTGLSDPRLRAAEAMGRRGDVDTERGPLPLARAADRQGTKLPELCRRLASPTGTGNDAGRRGTGLQ